MQRVQIYLKLRESGPFTADCRLWLVRGRERDGLHWKLWLVLWRQPGLGNPRQINHTAGASARVRTDYALFTAESAHLFWVQLKDPNSFDPSEGLFINCLQVPYVRIGRVYRFLIFMMLDGVFKIISKKTGMLMLGRNLLPTRLR